MDGGQRTEDGGQRTEDRGRRTEDAGRGIVGLGVEGSWGWELGVGSVVCRVESCWELRVEEK